MKEYQKLNKYTLCRKLDIILDCTEYREVIHNGINFNNINIYLSFTTKAKMINGVNTSFMHNYMEINGLKKTQHLLISHNVNVNNLHRGFTKKFIMNHGLYDRVNYAGFMFRAKIHGLISMESITQEEKVYLFNILHEKTNRDLYMYAYSTRDWMIKNMYENCYNGYENLYSNM